jgi:uncharacterized protein (UPF0332 family)
MARLSQDLLALARILATREPRRPKQASLRRSVSTAYYALFHFLIEEATLLLVGAAHGDVRLRQLAARAFIHAKMKSLCIEFVKTNPQHVHELLRPFLGGLNVADRQAIQTVAQAFVDLQDERHNADYNVSITFSRQDALNAFTRAQGAFNTWRQLKIANRELCRFFAVSLTLWPSLAGR